MENIKGEVMMNQKTFSRVATIIMMVAALFLLLTACVNPYKHLSKRPPLTAKDSAALFSRCINLITVDTTTAGSIKPLIPVLPDSTEYYKNKIDSLGKIKQQIKDSIRIRYKDSCRESAAIFENGFNLGYKVGEYNNNVLMTGIHQTALRQSDSVCFIQANKIKLAYNLKVAAAENALGIANKEINKYRNKSDKWKTAFMWAAAFGVLFLIVCILLWKFRRHAKAANSIINSSKDIVDNVKKLV